jgi:hypothetical protein
MLNFRAETGKKGNRQVATLQSNRRPVLSGKRATTPPLLSLPLLAIFFCARKDSQERAYQREQVFDSTAKSQPVCSVGVIGVVGTLCETEQFVLYQYSEVADFLNGERVADKGRAEVGVIDRERGGGSIINGVKVRTGDSGVGRRDGHWP